MSAKIDRNERNGGRLLRHSVAALLLVALLQVVNSAPASAATPPMWAYGRYISANCQTPSHFTTLGKNLANAVDAGTKPVDSLTILSFGATVNFGGGTWGATCFGGPDSTTAQITTDAQKFALGFYNNIDTGGATAKISVGTTTDTLQSWTDANITAHATAWAGMINTLNSWAIGNGYSSRVSFSGASDMEMAFASPAKTRTWVNGFAAAIDNWNLFNFGDAAGCTQSVGGDTSLCGTPSYPQWDSSDVWYISWGSGVSNPAPQIYVNAMANEWYALARYATDVHPAAGRMNFVDALSEKAACGCSEFTPAAAWNHLYNLINGDPLTADDIRWSTNFTFD
jgi:hypothetical protein